MASTEELLARIEELENQLAEAEQLIDAIKAGEVDAFAVNTNDKPEIFTLQSGDYAYRILVENFGEGAINISEDGLIVYTNTYFYELLGLPYEKVIGNSLLQFIDPASQDTFTALFKKGMAGQSKGEINLLAGERIIPVYVSLTSLHPTLPTVGMIVTDLTEKKQQEKALEEKNIFIETIIESSHELIAVYDRDCTLLTMNRACEEFLGMPREQLVGKKLLAILNGKTGSKVEADLLKALSGAFVQNEAHRSPVTGKYIQNYITPLRDEKGDVHAALIIAHDVTDIKKAEEDTRKANELLEEKNIELARSNTELASFSYIASHDLQEPLRKIQTFSGRILEKGGDDFSPAIKDYFHRITSASERMQNLISALLHYSRVNRGEIDFEPLHLNVVVREIKNNLAEMIEETGTRIEAGKLPVVKVVPHQFTQLLTNIIVNAIKYHRPGVAPVITIKAGIMAAGDINDSTITGADNYQVISIADNGIGFEQEYAEKIFEMFQRLHGRSEYEGTGIGLAICKKIMQNHKGFIKAQGYPGTGAVFTLYLPVEQQDDFTIL